MMTPRPSSICRASSASKIAQQECSSRRSTNGPFLVLIDTAILLGIYFGKAKIIMKQTRNEMVARGVSVLLALQLAAILPLSVDGQSPLDEVGFCGDCYCVPPIGEACPGMETMPQVEFSPELLTTLRAMPLNNPFFLGCNPYENEACNTDPPLGGTEGMCVVELSVPQTGAVCPNQFSYSLATVASREEVQAHQLLTHEGACGVCSSLQDLSVYTETPNLSALGISCALRAQFNFDDGVACYIEAGFSQPCALMWAYKSLQTNLECGDTCALHAISGNPNFGPPPLCEPVECLVCDEQLSGPKFQQFAGRSQPNSGLLSGQVRNCADIAAIVQVDPCQSSILGLAACEDIATSEEANRQASGTQCSCANTNDEAEMTCVEIGCTRCNSAADVCATYSFGETFSAQGQTYSFSATATYIVGLANRVTYSEDRNGCQLSVDDELCTSCVNIVCDDFSPGLQVACDNVPNGTSLSTCDLNFVTDGPLQFFDPGQFQFDECVDLAQTTPSPSAVPSTALPLPTDTFPPTKSCGQQFASCNFGAGCCSGRCVAGQCRLASLFVGKAGTKLSEGRGGAGGVPKGRIRGL